MKIVLVTREQFVKIWRKVIPAERFDVGLHSPSLFLRVIGVLLLIKDDIEILSAAEFPDVESPADIDVRVNNKTLFIVG